MASSDEFVPFTRGGPPVTLLDAVRRTMQPKGGLDHPRSLTPRQVHAEIREQWPDGWPWASTLDVANAMQDFYG